jgi:hypothetical protein
MCSAQAVLAPHSIGGWWQRCAESAEAERWQDAAEDGKASGTTADSEQRTSTEELLWLYLSGSRLQHPSVKTVSGFVAM